MSTADALRRWFLAALAAAACLPQWALAGTSNSLLDISTDGKLLACSNRDSGTVSIVDLATNAKVHEIKVGLHPEGVSFLGSTHHLAVAVYGNDMIMFIDGDTGEKTGATDVFDEPYGVVSDKAGKRLFVSLDYPGQIIEIDAETKRVVKPHEAGRFVRGLALSADEQRLYATEYHTGTVVALDAVSGKKLDTWPGTSNDNLARQIALHPSRAKAYLPHIRSRVTAVHGEGSIFPYVSVVDTAPGEGKRRRRVPMDAFLGNLVTSSPWETVVSPDGKCLFVVFAGTDDLFACNLINDDYRELGYRQYLKLGKNPRAARVSPDSNTLYVYQALDFSVVALDAKTLKTLATIPVTSNPLGDAVLRGKVLFYSAQQPMVGRRWITCASCHPDGDSDGRTWSNPEGLRNTQALFGLAWTHPLHWSADRDEVQDFEHTIRGPLMQGRGLISEAPRQELGEPNKGRSADLDALAAYTNSHRHNLSPHAKGGLSDAAKKGRSVFFAEETRCAVCHAGPLFTDSRPAGKGIMHDVGTGGDDPKEKLGPAYDTPSLLGAYRTAPYLHHGRAESLPDVLTKCNPDDKHGKTSHLTAQQIADLVEFLKALPYEDPEIAAKQAGLTKVEE